MDTSNNIISAFKNLSSSVPYNISKFITFDLEQFLRNFVKHQKIDLVHIDYLHMGWTLDIVKSISKVPVVLRQHDLHFRLMQRFYKNENNPLIKYFAYLQYKKFLTYEPDLCEKFDKCIMITKSDEKELLGLNPKIKTQVISIGVEEKLLEMHNNDKIPFSMFHLGPLDWLPNKDGLEWFLAQIFPKVISKIPDAKLYIYSTGGDQLRIDKSLRKNIILEGYVDNIWEEVKDKELLIVPLRIGSGIRVKIIEMLAAGKSIVTTDIGKEGIDAIDGKHLLVSNKPDEFADKIVSFFNNEYDKEKIRNNARELIKEKYTWSRIADELESVYLDLINKN
ncbi:MAG TPA: glycosyltransferase family 4 protein [Ignavibacteriaceae bacterium]|nr:glycosyltransferase family 4 protein [Ignavibacteriaceae bacterium]